MPDISSPDQVAGCLAEVRKRHSQHVSPTWPEPGICVSELAAGGKWPCSAARLLAAVEAALIRHQGSVDYDYPQEGRFCAPCGEWWPCREYQDITRALLGEES